MNRKTLTLLKILLSLFALNSISLYLYFSNHQHQHQHQNHPQTENHHPSTENRFPLTENHYSHFSKPWPILPSYLPWSQPTTAVHLRSCEGYFGNGFNRRIDLHGANIGTGGGGGGGWFRCFYSETLRSSICEGGKVRMNVGKIKMSKGGEKLDEVIGRGELEELPEFENGAFEIEGNGKLGLRLVSEEFLNEFVPQGSILKHTMRSLIGSIRLVDAKGFDCDQVRVS